MNQPKNWVSRNSTILVFAAVAALILFRTLPYEFFGNEILDSDESIFALMAKHLSVGKAFPVFAYNQSYLLGQVSWLAAPLYRLFGPTVAMFRLPMAIMNLVVGFLLIFLLRRESRLKTWDAWICALWFLIPSVRTARGLTNGADGAIEPYLYLLVIWMLRKRPLLAGLIAGVGMSGRPFVFYGVVSILILELASRKNIKAFLKQSALWGTGLVLTYSAIRELGRHASNYRASGLPLYMKSVRHMLEDVRGFFAEIIPQTIGLETQRWFPTSTTPGMNNHWNVLTLALALVGACLFVILLRQLTKLGRRGLEKMLGDETLLFPIYLVLISFLTFTAYVVLSPPSEDIRYTYCLILGMVGIYALQKRVGLSARLWRWSLVFVLGTSLVNLGWNALSWADLAEIEHAHRVQNLIAYLRANQIYASEAADYWTSNNLSFLSNEEIVVTRRYGNIKQEVAIWAQTPVQNRAVIDIKPCPGGTKVEGWYVCPYNTAVQ